MCSTFESQGSMQLLTASQQATGYHYGHSRNLIALYMSGYPLPPTGRQVRGYDKRGKPLGIHLNKKMEESIYLITQYG